MDAQDVAHERHQRAPQLAGLEALVLGVQRGRDLRLPREQTLALLKAIFESLEDGEGAGRGILGGGHLRLRLRLRLRLGLGLRRRRLGRGLQRGCLNHRRRLVRDRRLRRRDVGCGALRLTHRDSSVIVYRGHRVPPAEAIQRLSVVIRLT